jgi:hypothetical protein
MKRILFLLLAIVIFGTIALVPATPARAADPLASVTSVTSNGGIVTIQGTVPCAAWKVFTTSSVYQAGNQRSVSIYVYRLKRPGVACTASVAYTTTVTPVSLKPGVGYPVYVNSKWRLTMFP